MSEHRYPRRADAYRNHVDDEWVPFNGCGYVEVRKPGGNWFHANPQMISRSNEADFNRRVNANLWRETFSHLPPLTDITKLDGAGVFHRVEAPDELAELRKQLGERDTRIQELEAAAGVKDAALLKCDALFDLHTSLPLGIGAAVRAALSSTAGRDFAERFKALEAKSTEYDARREAFDANEIMLGEVESALGCSRNSIVHIVKQVRDRAHAYEQYVREVAGPLKRLIELNDRPFATLNRIAQECQPASTQLAKAVGE